MPPRLAKGHQNYEAQLRAHFTAVVRAQRARHDHNRQDQKVNIVEVTIARQQHRALALLLKRGRLLQQLAETDARLAGHGYKPRTPCSLEERGQSPSDTRNPLAPSTWTVLSPLLQAERVENPRVKGGSIFVNRLFGVGL